MTRVSAAFLVAAVLAACTATATPSAAPGVVVNGVRQVCDAAPSSPSPLTCASALAVALPGAGFTTALIDFVEFHYGAYCAPGAPCASAFPNEGYVVVHLKAPGPGLLIQLSADGSGRVTVEYTRPFPSTAP